MSRTTDLIHYVAALTNGALQIEDASDGWPARGVVDVDGTFEQVAIFVRGIGLTHRRRDDVERRFQNPVNRPLISEAGRLSVLLGVWESDPLVDVDRTVLAVTDAVRREGRPTRQSMFVPLETLIDATSVGWATSSATRSGLIACLVPQLLPVVVESIIADAMPEPLEVQRMVRASGFLDSAGSRPGGHDDRVRRTVTTLVRDTRFSGQVLDAYGRVCAMCGLGISLVQAAHVLPVAVPGSTDRVSNGIALCANHHLAFDRFLIAIHPRTLKVVVNPEIVDIAFGDPAVDAFLRSTSRRIRRPRAGAELDRDMLRARYEHFHDEYAWFW